MTTAIVDQPTVETLIHREDWAGARALIQRELADRPGDHWLLTQLGVTHYEQGDYRGALPHLVASLEIVPDCPLTLWNLAGALDALGKSKTALAIYAWLLRSDKSAADDPCWEGDEWADALKTDCVYRVGCCLRQIGQPGPAADCFRQYVNLVLAGMTGSYNLDDAARHIRELRPAGEPTPRASVRAAFHAALRDADDAPGGGELLKLSRAELLAL